MSDVMAVVDQPTWRREEGRFKTSFAPGYILKWHDYVTKDSLIERYLEPGDRLFLVTARQERLWLAAVYEQVRLESKVGTQFQWRAPYNKVPIIDITTLRAKLKFHTGNGLTAQHGKLGNSLQSPRMLTDRDVALLEAAIRKGGTSIAPRRRISVEVEAMEGEAMCQEVTRYMRDPSLGLACLKRDQYKCCHCRFVVDKKHFPKIFEEITARIVHAHHIRPISTGKRKTKVTDLLTLCPTCHAVAHALAAVMKSGEVALKLLRKFYKP